MSIQIDDDFCEECEEYHKVQYANGQRLPPSCERKIVQLTDSTLASTIKTISNNSTNENQHHSMPNISSQIHNQVRNSQIASLQTLPIHTSPRRVMLTNQSPVFRRVQQMSTPPKQAIHVTYQSPNSKQQRIQTSSQPQIIINHVKNYGPKVTIENVNGQVHLNGKRYDMLKTIKEEDNESYCTDTNSKYQSQIHFSPIIKNIVNPSNIVSAVSSPRKIVINAVSPQKNGSLYTNRQSTMVLPSRVAVSPRLSAVSPPKMKEQPPTLKASIVSNKAQATSNRNSMQRMYSWKSLVETSEQNNEESQKEKQMRQRDQSRFCFCLSK